MTDFPDDGPAPGASPLRHYRDECGAEWRVREAPACGGAPAPRPTCLLFESATAVRRVWDFPPHWYFLGDTELEALSWRR